MPDDWTAYLAPAEQAAVAEWRARALQLPHVQAVRFVPQWNVVWLVERCGYDELDAICDAEIELHDALPDTVFGCRVQWVDPPQDGEK
jgi:hypothetical protein